MIYFVRAVADGPIKIGTTIRLTTRLREFRSMFRHSNFNFTILGVMDGDRKVEKDLHERFASERLSYRRDHGFRGGWWGEEWFAPSLRLLTFIAENGREWRSEDDAPLTTSQASETLRVTAELAEAVRLAASMKKMSIMDYLDKIVLPVARRDILSEAKRIAKQDKSD